MLEADVKAGVSWLKNKWYTMTNTFIKKGEEQMKQAMTMMNKLFRAEKNHSQVSEVMVKLYQSQPYNLNQPNFSKYLCLILDLTFSMV